MNQSTSLVRYDNPVLVVTTKGGKQGSKKLPPVESKVRVFLIMYFLTVAFPQLR